MSTIELTVKLKNHLRILMAKEGFKNIQALASESGLHANTLYKLDNGEDAKVNVETVCKLLWVFNCKFEDLFDYQVETNEPDSWDDLAPDLQAEILASREMVKKPASPKTPVVTAKKRRARVS